MAETCGSVLGMVGVFGVTMEYPLKILSPRLPITCKMKMAGNLTIQSLTHLLEGMDFLFQKFKHSIVEKINLNFSSLSFTFRIFTSCSCGAACLNDSFVITQTL